MKNILIIDDIRSDFDIFTDKEVYQAIEENVPRDNIVIVRSFDMGIKLLNAFRWDVLYLDNDLGGVKQGYDIMCFLEQNLQFLPRNIIFITANPPAKQKMIQCYNSILQKISFVDLNNTNHFAIIDKEDEQRTCQLTWHETDSGYACNKSTDRSIKLHRLIMNAEKGVEIDHINRSKLDNRKENLRIVNHSQNSKNLSKTKSKTTSNFKGVSWYKKRQKWRAYIVLNNKQTHLGYFDSEYEAALKYNQKAQELFGEYANLNKLTELKL